MLKMAMLLMQFLNRERWRYHLSDDQGDVQYVLDKDGNHITICNDAGKPIARIEIQIL
jgi:hypothetical protein